MNINVLHFIYLPHAYFPNKRMKKENTQLNYVGKEIL